MEGRRGGDEDTGGNSDGRGKNKQQSTKSSGGNSDGNGNDDSNDNDWRRRWQRADGNKSAAEAGSAVARRQR